MKFLLLLFALLIIIALTGYAASLWLKLHRHKRLVLQAKNDRLQRVLESVVLIAQAMSADQCNLSEGVLRLKPLLDVLGKKLSAYPAMWALYQVVAEMPILDERKALARHQRMRLDLTREAAEAKFDAEIKLELRSLLSEMNNFKIKG